MGRHSAALLTHTRWCDGTHAGALASWCSAWSSENGGRSSHLHSRGAASISRPKVVRLLWETCSTRFSVYRFAAQQLPPGCACLQEAQLAGSVQDSDGSGGPAL